MGTHSIMAASCLLAVRVCLADPIIVQQFTALTQSQTADGYIYIPPDTDGAIGPNNIFVSSNQTLAIYNKTGSLVPGGFQSQTTFWGNALGAGSPAPSGDMRVLYDASSGRWFASALAGDGNGNSILIARSDSSDPAGAWHGTSFVMGANSADFPTMGVDANGVYIGSNNFNGNTFTGESLVSIPKASLLSASPSTNGMVALLDNDPSGNYGFTLQGVSNGAGGGNPGFVLGAVPWSNSVALTQINNPGGKATLGSPTHITIGTALNDPSPVGQPGLPWSLDPGDSRFSSEVVQVGGKIYGVNSTLVGGVDELEWYVLDGAGNLLSNGLLPNTGNDQYYPSIAANMNGDVVIGYNESGASENITAWAVVGTTSGNRITFGSPLEIVQSKIDNYFQDFGTGENRWGDYSATWVDPSDPTKFWTFQEWAQPYSWNDSTLVNNQWAYQVGVMYPGSVPEPSTLVLVGCAWLGFAWCLRKRSRAQRR